MPSAVSSPGLGSDPSAQGAHDGHVDCQFSDLPLLPGQTSGITRPPRSTPSSASCIKCQFTMGAGRVRERKRFAARTPEVGVKLSIRKSSVVRARAQAARSRVTRQPWRSRSCTARRVTRAAWRHDAPVAGGERCSWYGWLPTLKYFLWIGTPEELGEPKTKKRLSMIDRSISCACRWKV